MIIYLYHVNYTQIEQFALTAQKLAVHMKTWFIQEKSMLNDIDCKPLVL